MASLFKTQDSEYKFTASYVMRQLPHSLSKLNVIQVIIAATDVFKKGNVFKIELSYQNWLLRNAQMKSLLNLNTQIIKLTSLL